MKLTYWIAKQENDHTCYDVRAKTRKECSRLVSELHNAKYYGKPEKVTVEYEDAFDLMIECRGHEDSGYWE